MRLFSLKTSTNRISFTPFLSHLYNVKKLDSNPKCVDETSRISGCFLGTVFKKITSFLEILCMQSP